MVRKLLIVCLAFLFTGKMQLSAQCFDSTRVVYGAYCDPTWTPVCACNGLTYRNDCFARNAGIVNNNFVYGICDAVDFDFNPNPATDYIDIHAIMKNVGTLYVQVFDRFGRLFYTNEFPNTTDLTFQISVRSFPIGIYYINIYCKDGYRVKKLLVPEIQ